MHLKYSLLLNQFVMSSIDAFFMVLFADVYAASSKWFVEIRN